VVEFDAVRFVIDALMLTSIYLILSSSLNLEYGYAGIPNMGKVLFFATGSFTVASLSVRIAARLLGFSYSYYPAESRILAAKVNEALSAMPALSLSLFAALTAAAMASSLAVAVLLAHPTLRLRETYLGVTLLAAGEILRYIGRYEEGFIGGTLGSPVIDVFAWVGRGRAKDATVLAVYLCISIATWLLVKRVALSPYGRALKAIRDDEEASSSVGKDANGERMRVLMLGSLLSGLAGALYAFYLGHVDSGDFTPDKTFLAFLMVIIGGKANPYGPIAGAALYVFVEKIIRQVKHAFSAPFDVNYLAILLMGLVLLLIMLFRPRGIFEERDDLEGLHKSVIEERAMGAGSSSREGGARQSQENLYHEARLTDSLTAS